MNRLLFTLIILLHYNKSANSQTDSKAFEKPCSYISTDSKNALGIKVKIFYPCHWKDITDQEENHLVKHFRDSTDTFNAILVIQELNSSSTSMVDYLISESSKAGLTKEGQKIISVRKIIIDELPAVEIIKLVKEERAIGTLYAKSAEYYVDISNKFIGISYGIFDTNEVNLENLFDTYLDYFRSYATGIRIYNKIIELRTSDDFLVSGLAKYKAQNYYLAISDYTKAIELSPKRADVYNERGKAKDEINNYKEALEDFNKAIELKPFVSEYFYNRGVCKTKQLDYQGALVDFSKSIELNPNDTASYYNRGVAKQKLNNFKSSIVDFNKAIEKSPKFARAYLGRGVSKVSLQDFAGSILDFTKAIEIDNKLGEAFFNRGISKIILNQKRAGCLDLQKAGELGIFKSYELINEYCK